MLKEEYKSKEWADIVIDAIPSIGHLDSIPAVQSLPDFFNSSKGLKYKRYLDDVANHMLHNIPMYKDDPEIITKLETDKTHKIAFAINALKILKNSAKNLVTNLNDFVANKDHKKPEESSLARLGRAALTTGAMAAAGAGMMPPLEKAGDYVFNKIGDMTSPYDDGVIKDAVKTRRDHINKLGGSAVLGGALGAGTTLASFRKRKRED